MKYIDLDLPSGTLWSDTNEAGFYTFDEAVEKYGDNLPTYEQFIELQAQCQWKWNGSGYDVIGPNGNTIVLPAVGGRYCDDGVFGVSDTGDYWSSTPDGSDYAWFLYFSSSRMNMNNNDRCTGFSVRLVESKNKNKTENNLEKNQDLIMENKDDKVLNLVEVLKDCPIGTELYTPMFGKVRLVKVDANNKGMPICVELQTKGTRCLTSDGRYCVDTDGECVLFPSKDNRDWTTFQAPRKEHVFKPFDKVLVRAFDDREWRPGLFGFKSEYGYCVSCIYWSQCIPYEGNEHLLGTCDSPDEKGGEE